MVALQTDALRLLTILCISACTWSCTQSAEDFVVTDAATEPVETDEATDIGGGPRPDAEMTRPIEADVVTDNSDDVDASIPSDGTEWQDGSDTTLDQTSEETTNLGCIDDTACEGTECAPGRCIEGICATIFQVDGSPCDDGTACSVGDRCDNGVCIGGIVLDCSDANSCTDDFCDPSLGCVHQFNFAPCDDSDPCTAQDQCVGGLCLGGTFACDDLNPCTDDLCVPGSGQCFNTPDDTRTCSDDNACTAGDQCQSGVCQPGSADGCDDHNPCTADSCVDEQCKHLGLEFVSCEDGDPCSIGDTCQLGVCVGGQPNLCDDGDPCTLDTCEAPVGCKHEGASGAACDDGNACSISESCDEMGACTPTSWLTCDDDSPCTQDTCDPSSGCSYQVIAGECDDGDACTFDDACVLGICHGTAKDCDDDNVCTADSCDPVAGCQYIDTSDACSYEQDCAVGYCDPATGCVTEHLGGACDDGLHCTEADTCLEGSCTGTALDCDDGHPCSINVCDEEEGCVSVPSLGACDDGDACSGLGQCSAQGQCVPGEPVEIDDGVPCTVDSCSPDTGPVHIPSDALCPEGRLCDADIGCRLVSPSLLIVKIALRGSVESEAPWIALANISGAAIALDGLLLVNNAQVSQPLKTNGQASASLGPGAVAAAVQVPSDVETIPPGFSAIFHPGQEGDFFQPDGDTVMLVDEHGLSVDSVVFEPLASSGVPAGGQFVSLLKTPTEFDAAAAVVATSADDNDPAGLWCAWPEGSGAPQGPLLSCARGVLNEIKLADPDERFIELHLPSGGPLAGLHLHLVDSNGVTLSIIGPLTGRAPIDTFPVLIHGQDEVELPLMTSGAVHLVRQGEPLDTYGFGTLTTQMNEATGWPMVEGQAGPTGLPGTSAVRVSDGVDHDDNASDWTSISSATPGSPNP